jgi:hypothetical protein
LGRVTDGILDVLTCFCLITLVLMSLQTDTYTTIIHPQSKAVQSSLVASLAERKFGGQGLISKVDSRGK